MQLSKASKIVWLGLHAGPRKPGRKSPSVHNFLNAKISRWNTQWLDAEYGVSNNMAAASMLLRKRTAATDLAPTSKKARFADQDIEESSPFDKTTPSSPPSTTFTEGASIADTSATSRSTSKRPKRYVCEYSGCTKVFDRPVRLQAHIRTHTNDRPFACKESGCTKRFFKAEHLKAHIQNKHSDEANHVCTYVINTNADGEALECGKSFTTATRLRRHVAMHEEKEGLKCQEVGCGQLFRKLETLQRHIKKEHLKENAFRCAQIVYDGDVAAADDAMPEECGQTFATVGQLKTHENREHAGLKYFCDICSSSLSQGDHDDIDEAMHLVGFPTYNDLQAHNKAVHPPTCTFCGTACESNRALAAHMDIEHSSLTDRQKYKCEYPGCERAFTRQGNLKVHVQSVHVKAKKFVCGEFDLTANERCPGWNSSHGCGLNFSTKATLESHVRTQHLDLPTIRRKSKTITKVKIEAASTPPEFDSPPEFDEMFATGPALSLLTGHGYENERPIACWTPGCPVRFHRDFDLARHMELAHGWNVDDINDCLVERGALGGEQFWIGGDEDEGLRAGFEQDLSLQRGFASEFESSQAGFLENDLHSESSYEPTRGFLQSPGEFEQQLADLQMSDVDTTDALRYREDSQQVVVDPALL